MLIPNGLKKNVVFLGVRSTSDPSSTHWGGTAFFVYHPGSRPNMGFYYLVTAKHVVDHLRSRKYYIRANAKSGESVTIECDEDVTWHFNPDDTSADVGVLPVPMIKAFVETMDFTPLPTSCFFNEAERAKIGISEGSGIAIIGLFSKHAGKSKNHPLIRCGNVAMFPEERIPTKDYGDMEAYLIEARSIGGLSGSPVFVIQHVNFAQTQLHLLGVVQGHWDVSPESIIDTSTQDAKAPAGVNMGIAIVTPAKKILEILNCPSLRIMREESERRFIEENSPTPD